MGSDARRGKLTLFDAEGPREPGAFEHVALRVSDLAAARAALPEGTPEIFDIGEGIRVTLVEAPTDVEYDLDHVALRTADPEATAARLRAVRLRPGRPRARRGRRRVRRASRGRPGRVRTAVAQPPRGARRLGRRRDRRRGRPSVSRSSRSSTRRTPTRPFSGGPTGCASSTSSTSRRSRSRDRRRRRRHGRARRRGPTTRARTTPSSCARRARVSAGRCCLSSCVIWRHRTWDDVRRECPAGDEALQRLVFERLDDALAWLRRLGAPVVREETGNPLTFGTRFDPRGADGDARRHARARSSSSRTASRGERDDPLHRRFRRLVRARHALHRSGGVAAAAGEPVVDGRRA